MDFPYLCVVCEKESETHICEECRERPENYLNVKVQEKIPHELPQDKLSEFVLGGNATFTLRNLKKGTHLTFKVVGKEIEDSLFGVTTLFFVSVLTGPNNDLWTNYTQLGTIRGGIYRRNKSSKIGENATSNVVFNWFWENRNRLPPSLKVMHEGKCGRCGHKLTVPESILSRFGPECKKFIGV